MERFSGHAVVTLGRVREARERGEWPGPYPQVGNVDRRAIPSQKRSLLESRGPGGTRVCGFGHARVGNRLGMLVARAGRVGEEGRGPDDEEIDASLAGIVAAFSDSDTTRASRILKVPDSDASISGAVMASSTLGLLARHSFQSVLRTKHHRPTPRRLCHSHRRSPDRE